jgi:hypothetical protein
MLNKTPKKFFENYASNSFLRLFDESFQCKDYSSKQLGRLKNTKKYCTTKDIKSNLPIGLILRVEYAKKHLDFINARSGLPYIMLNLNTVNTLIKTGITAQDLFPKGKIITTSTIHDNKLPYFDIETEVSIIKKFAPSYHIPCDYPVYFEDDSKGRKWFIDALVESTFQFIKRMKNYPTITIPLIKGINENEWNRSVSPFQEVGINYFSFYAKQYFGSYNGRNDRLLTEHINGLISTTNLEYLMLIGYQPTKTLSKLPMEVKAFAGQRWITKSHLNTYSPEQSVTAYWDWEKSFTENDRSRQSVLKMELEEKWECN